VRPANALAAGVNDCMNVLTRLTTSVIPNAEQHLDRSEAERKNDGVFMDCSTALLYHTADKLVFNGSALCHVSQAGSPLTRLGQHISDSHGSIKQQITAGNVDGKQSNADSGVESG